MLSSAVGFTLKLLYFAYSTPPGRTLGHSWQSSSFALVCPMHAPFALLLLPHGMQPNASLAVEVTHAAVSAAAAMQASGWATTFAVTAYGSRSSQVESYIAAVVPVVNDIQCAALPAFCRYSSSKGMAVSAMRAEGAAPPAPLSSAVPLAWQPNGKVRR
jgi:hypothetical protein